MKRKPGKCWKHRPGQETIRRLSPNATWQRHSSEPPKRRKADRMNRLSPAKRLQVRPSIDAFFRNQPALRTQLRPWNEYQARDLSLFPTRLGGKAARRQPHARVGHGMQHCAGPRSAGFTFRQGISDDFIGHPVTFQPPSSSILRLKPAHEGFAVRSALRRALTAASSA